jgi:hypothetical protein
LVAGFLGAIGYAAGNDAYHAIKKSLDEEE